MNKSLKKKNLNWGNNLQKKAQRWFVLTNFCPDHIQFVSALTEKLKQKEVWHGKCLTRKYRYKRGTIDKQLASFFTSITDTVSLVFGMNPVNLKRNQLFILLS